VYLHHLLMLVSQFKLIFSRISPFLLFDEFLNLGCVHALKRRLYVARRHKQTIDLILLDLKFDITLYITILPLE
jgi:hypothetical protein